MTNLNSLNRQSLGEEIANAVSHGIGTLLAVIGTVILIVYAAYNSSVSGVVSASIYGFCLIFLYLMSTLYHALTNNTAKKIFQVLDHCSIFLLILGSYVPICLVLLPPELGWRLLGINLLLTVVGITLNAISLNKWKKLSLLLYVYGLVCYYCITVPLADAFCRCVDTVGQRRIGLHDRYIFLCG